MTFEERHLDQRVLRTLAKRGPQNEGSLASRCRKGLFMESWRDCVSRLVEGGLIVARHTGRGSARVLDLTEAGLAKASEAQPVRGDKASREAFVSEGL